MSSDFNINLIRLNHWYTDSNELNLYFRGQKGIVKQGLGHFFSPEV